MFKKKAFFKQKINVFQIFLKNNHNQFNEVFPKILDLLSQIQIFNMLLTVLFEKFGNFFTVFFMYSRQPTFFYF